MQKLKSHGGKLLVCSVDMNNISEDRIVTKQLKLSILKYMNSGKFNPETEVDLNKIKQLTGSKF